MNTKHNTSKDKCDSCGSEFDNKENLIKHIVDNHTVMGTHVIQRHICKICNVEVHGEEAKNNHNCRKPTSTCSFCKQSFYSQEARVNHICDQHAYKSVAEQLRALKRKTIECTHGIDCYRARLGKCWFKHTQPIQVFPHGGQGHQQVDQGQVQQTPPQGHVQQQNQGQEQWHVQGRHSRQGQQGLQGQQGQQEQIRQQGHQRNLRQQGPRQGHNGNMNPVLYCRFQERCYKGQGCQFKHFGQGFLQTIQNQNQQ